MMYFSDEFSFVLEVDSKRFPHEKGGLVPVDLSQEEDWGDIEPVMRKNESGDLKLSCTIGKFDGSEEDEDHADIIRVWEYREDKPLNNKFAFFEPVSIPDFVRRYLDASIVFGWNTEEEVEKLKESYGV